MTDDQPHQLMGPSPSVEAWLALAASDDWTERHMAVRSLIGTTSMLRRSRTVAQRLVELLDDAAPKVRLASALAFWQIRSREAIEPLTRWALVPDELGVVSLVALASQQVGAAAEALDRVREAWSKRPEDLARWLHALGWSGQERFGALLNEHLDHESWTVRWAAAKALAELGVEEGVLAAWALANAEDAPDRSPSAVEDRQATAKRLRHRWVRQHQEAASGDAASPRPNALLDPRAGRPSHH